TNRGTEPRLLDRPLQCLVRFDVHGSLSAQFSDEVSTLAIDQLLPETECHFVQHARQGELKFWEHSLLTGPAIEHHMESKIRVKGFRVQTWGSIAHLDGRQVKHVPHLVRIGGAGPAARPAPEPSFWLAGVVVSLDRGVRQSK